MPADSALTALPGCGPGKAERLRAGGIHHRAQLLIRPPRLLLPGHEPRPGAEILLRATLTRVQTQFVPRRGRCQLATLVAADGQPWQARWFHSPGLAARLHPGTTYRLHGHCGKKRPRSLTMPQLHDDAPGPLRLYPGLPSGIGPVVYQGWVDWLLDQDHERTTDPLEKCAATTWQRTLEDLHRAVDPATQEAARRAIAWREFRFHAPTQRPGSGFPTLLCGRLPADEDLWLASFTAPTNANHLSRLAYFFA